MDSQRARRAARDVDAAVDPRHRNFEAPRPQQGLRHRRSPPPPARHPHGRRDKGGEGRAGADRQGDGADRRPDKAGPPPQHLRGPRRPMPLADVGGGRAHRRQALLRRPRRRPAVPLRRAPCGFLPGAVMSVTAMNWAKRQRTGSPARKAILLILADYANAEGVSYPSRQRLADETDMSLDSVDRNIKDLEVAKFLTKVTGRGTGPHQKPNTYRLNLDLEALEKHLGRNRLYKTPEPHEAALPDGEDGGASDGSEPHPAGPQSEPQIPLDLGRSLGRTGAALTEEPLRRTGEPARASARDPQDDLFQEWWEAYPQHGGGFSKDRARVAWRALSDEDRALALEQAERITAKHMTRGKPKDPAWWLHDRVFATMAEQAPPRPAAEAS